jgi:hypothetical protein
MGTIRNMNHWNCNTNHVFNRRRVILSTQCFSVHRSGRLVDAHVYTEALSSRLIYSVTSVAYERTCSGG